MRTLYVADPDVWEPNLGAAIRTELDDGCVVVVRTVSTAALVLANVVASGGVVETYGIRRNVNDPFGSDGLALLMGRVEATSCCVWAPNGYRSSKPVTVHVLDAPDEDADTFGPWSDRRRELSDLYDDPLDWVWRMPDGHPPEPCPGNHCPLAAAVP